MKICFVVPKVSNLFYQNKQNNLIGGAEKQIYLLSKALATIQNIEVSCCANDIGQSSKDIKEGVTIWKIGRLKDNPLNAFLKLRSSLHKADADYYVFRSPGKEALPLVVYIRYILRKKAVYMIASNLETNYDTLLAYEGFFTARAMKKTYRIANLITAQTEFQQKAMWENYKVKILDIVRNGLEMNTDGNTEIQKKYILWVGRLNPVKRAELFLELAKKHPDLDFVMIAPPASGHADYQQKILELIQTVPNVVHKNYVAPSEMAAYYKQAIVYVMTSESEGFSNTVMEAMAEACPILSLDVNPDNLFEKHLVGLFANGNKELFFSQFDRLLSDNELRKELGENGKKYILNFHDIKEVSKQFLQILQ